MKRLALLLSFMPSLALAQTVGSGTAFQYQQQPSLPSPCSSGAPCLYSLSGGATAGQPLWHFGGVDSLVLTVGNLTTDATLTGNGTTATPLKLNLATGNTWTGATTFTQPITVHGSTIDPGSPTLNQALVWNGFSFVPTTIQVGFTITPIKTANYAASISELVRVDPTAGGFTVTLPSAIGQSGFSVAIKNVGSSNNTLTVATSGGQTIDGVSNFTMNNGRQAQTFVSNGAGWMVF